VSVVSMKSLLEAGVHFGHRTRRWHPKMRSFIFTERNGIHIIDLQQTMRQVNVAYRTIRDIVREGGVVLFVGTKRQAHDTIRMEAERCGMPYVVSRWLGGTLTNFRTIRQRVEYMTELERRAEHGELDRLPKKEALKLKHQLLRLNTRIGGLRNMTRLPDALFVVDVQRESLAVTEANKLHIPIVAMVDTNCDPDPITYPIPSNDDAIRAIKLMTAKIADAVIEGQALRAADEADRIAEEEAHEPVEEGQHEPAGRFEETGQDQYLGPSTLAKLAQGLDQEQVETKVEVEAKQEPVEQEPAEAEQAQEPVEQEPTEAEQAQEPVEQEPAEAEQAQEPVEQEPAEAEQAQEPVEQEPTEAEQAQEPVEQEQEKA